MKQISERMILCIGAVTIAALAWAWLRDGDPILYNHSPSLPVGLYLRTNGPIERGAIVTVRAGDVAPGYAALRDFDGPGDRFIKRIAATQGGPVCARDDVITVNARTVAHRAAVDSSGRAWPHWPGCQGLSADDLLLLGDTPDSFDGRYFGLVQGSDIEGVWRRAW